MGYWVTMRSLENVIYTWYSYIIELEHCLSACMVDKLFAKHRGLSFHKADECSAHIVHFT